MKIERIVVTEVMIPAHPGVVNSASLDRPLHKLPIAGQPGWTVQFDDIPKIILQMRLDNGVVALGECYRGHDWNTVSSIADLLVGRSLDQLNRQALPIALCREYDGFECAIWDGFAKSHDLRVVDLLGGPVRDRILVGAWSGHRVVEEVGPLARRFADQGYTCIKFKCDLDDDVAAWCREIDRAAPGMKVILDPNERWERPYEVRRRIDQLAPIGNLLCLEDPIPRWMIGEYAELKRYSSVPIVLHISLPYILHGQRVQDAIVALRHEAVDGFNFNTGIAKFQQLDQIAYAAGLPCWHGSEVDLGILEAMYVHSCAAAQSCTWPSDIFGRMIRSHDLLETPLRFEPPYVDLPSGPGLGVTLDEDALKRYQTQQRVFPS